VWGFGSARGAGGYASAAIPARYALERGDWRGAAALEPASGTPASVEALTHFARALGAARSGDASTAERGAQALARLRDTLRSANDLYWATEVEVSRLGAAAWAAWARGKHDEALALMRAAADTEDASEKHIVTPGRLLPARELLGDMLADGGRPAEARKEFEASHRREPDRFRGLFGAAQAAARSGETAAAKRYFARLVELSGESASRPEVAQARAYLAANP
jgi:tetratricopeptide (TPR) repeat protein